MEIKSEMLRIQMQDFNLEYNDIMSQLFLVRDKIISDSKVRFEIISEGLLELKDDTLESLKSSKVIMDEYSEKNNWDLETAEEYYECVKKYGKKYNELKLMKNINKEDYDRELNNFINMFNDLYRKIIEFEYMGCNELVYFKDFGYFSEELIDELMELFEKYLLCVIKGNKLFEEINLTNDENRRRIK